jgi:very-short-patch-repair endonuclease
MKITYNPKLKDLAREMRNNPTDAEKHLWYYLKGDKLLGLDFYRQKPSENFIVDFYCDKISLVIEVDGGYHEGLNMLKKNGDRDLDLYNLGIIVIRFTNEEVLNKTYDVVKKIKEEVMKLLKIKNISL